MVYTGMVRRFALFIETKSGLKLFRTLQELLAPASVQFFSRERKLLGDKRSLQRQIHEITGIAIFALQGTSLSDFSVEERMSWAKHRHTKRTEDKAYSLLGLFNVYMPLIYGEGEDNALRRLHEEIRKRTGTAHHGKYRPMALHLVPQLVKADWRSTADSQSALDNLPCAIDAPFNSRRHEHEPECHRDTRVDLLRHIYTWANGRDKKCIFWLNGLAGTGKSTISRTVARHYWDQQRLAASFFFSRGGGDVGNADKFVTSIALQLAYNLPAARQHVDDAIKRHPKIGDQSLRDQWRHLVLNPLSKLNNSTNTSNYVLVVDALDECADEIKIRAVISLLAEARSLETVRLRVFLTSRPEIPIQHGLDQLQAEHDNFVLHRIEPSVVDHDIKVFLEYSFALIKQERSLSDDWPGDGKIKSLVEKASGLFIWAATAYRFVDQGKRFATKRLDTILEGGTNVATAPERHLDGIYTTVLKHSIAPDYTLEEQEGAYEMLRHVIGCIIILLSPLSSSSLSRLINVAENEINQTLADLHSILDIPREPNQPLRLHHPSFRDFLLSSNRCADPHLCVNEKHAHRALAEGCIQLMSNSLKQDICLRNNPGALVADIDKSEVDRRISLEVQYACLYWTEHLEKGDSQLQDDDQVHQFLQKHLLHWLEVLGWIGRASQGFYAAISLESMANVSIIPSL
jgi:hypothetical protein